MTPSLRRPSASAPRSAWTARSTLVVFAFLALTWRIPDVVDIYEYGGVPRLLFLPSYVLVLVLYDSPWGLENVVSAVDPFVPGSGRLLWAAGLVVTFYLFAVAVTWLGRRLTDYGSRSARGGDGNGGRAS